MAQEVTTGTYSVVDAAKRLGISTRTAYGLIAQGNFPVRTIRVGGAHKIPVEDLERFIAGEPVDVAS